MKFSWFVLIAMTSHAVAEDKVAAESAFRAAKELDKAGKLAEACPLYEVSFRADPQLGALLNLANCHEQTGRTATAWVEYRDAIELATRNGDRRVEYSKQHLAALEPRLMRLRIEAPHGVTIERNGTDVSALVKQDLVVDPGTYRVRATAVGKIAWETSVAVEREGETVRIEVPILAPVEAAPAPAPISAPAGVTAPTPVVTTPPPKIEHSSSRRMISFAVGGVGLATTAVGLGFGLHARNQWAASRDVTSCDAHNVCNATGTAQIASARSSASLATYALGAGVAILVTAGVIWWTAPRTEARRSLSVIPAVDPHGASVTAFARF